MGDIVDRITNHPNAKVLIFEILNEKTPFLYEILSGLNIWGSPEKTKKDLKRILEGYLLIQNRLGYEYWPSRKSYKEFLTDEETVRSVMVYLFRTLLEKNGTSLLVSLIAIWIALERKEEEFKRFFEECRKEESFALGETLTAFWIYSGFDVEEIAKAFDRGGER